MDSMKKILSLMRRAINDYDLIQDGDRIAVGVSGGKDSLALLLALKQYSIFSKEKFSVVGITIDNHRDSDFSKIEAWAKENDIEYHIVRSDINDIIFNERKEKNPCSLCSKLRRGMLNTKALELKCNKLALGHTYEDIVSTFCLSLIYEGRLSTIIPATYMTRTGMMIIRPLIYVTEKYTKGASPRLPVFENNCPANKKTQREYMNDMIKKLCKDIPFAKDRIFSAITSPDRYNLYDKANLDEKRKVEMSDQHQKGVFVMNYLESLDMHPITIAEAVSDENYQKSFEIIKNNPTISKQEFLAEMNLVEEQ